MIKISEENIGKMVWVKNLLEVIQQKHLKITDNIILTGENYINFA